MPRQTRRFEKRSRQLRRAPEQCVHGVATLPGLQHVADNGDAGVFRLIESEVRRDGVELETLTQCGRGFQLRGVDGAVEDIGREPSQELCARFAYRRGGNKAEVVVKVAAYLIVCIADALRLNPA